MIIVKAWIDAGKRWAMEAWVLRAMVDDDRRLLEFCGIRGSLRAAFQDREGQDEREGRSERVRLTRSRTQATDPKQRE